MPICRCWILPFISVLISVMVAAGANAQGEDNESYPLVRSTDKRVVVSEPEQRGERFLLRFSTPQNDTSDATETDVTILIESPFSQQRGEAPCCSHDYTEPDNTITNQPETVRSSAAQFNASIAAPTTSDGQRPVVMSPGDIGAFIMIIRALRGDARALINRSTPWQDSWEVLKTCGYCPREGTNCFWVCASLQCINVGIGSTGLVACSSCCGIGGKLAWGAVMTVGCAAGFRCAQSTATGHFNQVRVRITLNHQPPSEEERAENALTPQVQSDLRRAISSFYRISQWPSLVSIHSSPVRDDGMVETNMVIEITTPWDASRTIGEILSYYGLSDVADHDDISFSLVQRCYGATNAAYVSEPQ